VTASGDSSGEALLPALKTAGLLPQADRQAEDFEEVSRSPTMTVNIWVSEMPAFAAPSDAVQHRHGDGPGLDADCSKPVGDLCPWLSLPLALLTADRHRS